LNTQSAEIGNAIYKMDWTMFPADLMKTLLIIIMRSKRPIKITSGHIITLSNESFVKVNKIILRRRMKILAIFLILSICLFSVCYFNFCSSRSLEYLTQYTIFWKSNTSENDYLLREEYPEINFIFAIRITYLMYMYIYIFYIIF